MVSLSRDSHTHPRTGPLWSEASNSHSKFGDVIDAEDSPYCDDLGVAIDNEMCYFPFIGEGWDRSSAFLASTE